MRFHFLSFMLTVFTVLAVGCGGDGDPSATTPVVNNNNQTQEAPEIAFCGVSDSKEGCEQMGCELAMLGYHGSIEDGVCQLEDPYSNPPMLCYQYVSGEGSFIHGNAFTVYVREDGDAHEVLYANGDYFDTLVGWTYCNDSDVREACQACPSSLQ